MLFVGYRLRSNLSLLWCAERTLPTDDGVCLKPQPKENETLPLIGCGTHMCSFSRMRHAECLGRGRCLVPRFTLRTLFGIMTCLPIYLSVATVTDFVRATLFVAGLLTLRYRIRVARTQFSYMPRALCAIVGLALLWVASIEWYGEQQRCVRCGDVNYVSGYRCLGLWISRTEISLNRDRPPSLTCDHCFQELDRWHSWWGLIIPVRTRTQDMILTLETNKAAM